MWITTVLGIACRYLGHLSEGGSNQVAFIVPKCLLCSMAGRHHTIVWLDATTNLASPPSAFSVISILSRPPISSSRSLPTFTSSLTISFKGSTSQDLKYMNAKLLDYQKANESQQLDWGIYLLSKPKLYTWFKRAQAIIRYNKLFPLGKSSHINTATHERSFSQALWFWA